MVSAGVLAISGFAFWLVAGRFLDDQSLGQAAALISLVLFLSGVTRLNMAASLPAILPGAGGQGRRVLRQAYSLAIALGLGVSVVVVTWAWLTGQGTDLFSSWLIPLYVVAWSVFSMQDGALVAADASKAVAIENTLYSITRLVAVVVALAIAPTLSSALIAWFLPLAVAIPVVNIVLWKSFAGPPKPGWNPSGIGRLVASDFFGSIAILASTRGFAYLAIALLPADPGSELAVAWLFFITVDVAFLQASNALATEVFRSPGTRDRLVRSATDAGTVVGMLGGVAGMVLSPFLLGLLLEDPSADVVTALRFIFAALMARPIIHLWLADARANRDHGRLTTGPVLALGVLILAVTPGFVGDDIVVVAAGVAASQWLVAIVAWIDLRTTGRLVSQLMTSDGLVDLDVQGADTVEGPLTRSWLAEGRRPGKTDIGETDIGVVGETPVTAPDGPPAIAATRTYSLQDLEQRSTAFTGQIRVALASTVGGFVLLALSVPAVDYDRVDGLGLLRALPAVFWASIAATTVGFILFLLNRHRIGAASSVALLTLSLHGIEPMSAPVARFSVAWLLAGFSEVVAETGATQRLIDARFSWPGFFLGPAAGLSGRQDALAMPEVGSIVGLDKSIYVEPLIRYWPLLMVAVWVLIVWAYARHWYPNQWTVAPLAAWLFALLAWTGQDYFSPQSMGVTLSAVIVLLIAIAEPDVPTKIPWNRRLLMPVSVGGDVKRNPAITTLILVLAAAVIVSHPLSPVFLTIWLLPLAIAGYRYARGLPILVFVCFLTWVSGAARPWWSSRIESLIGNVGAVGSTVSESTAARAAEASTERTLVLLSRAQIIVLAGEFALMAAIYLWRIRGNRSAVVLIGLAGLPALAAAGQPYGGEILVRVFLFSVFPICVVLAAGLACIGSKRLLAVLLITITLTGAPAFVVNRFGNESFEMTTVSDAQAIAALYEQSPADTLFITDDPFLAWGYTRFQRIDGHRNHRYLGRLAAEEDTIERVVEAAREAGYDNAAIVTANSQEAWGVNATGRPVGWLNDVAEFLEDHPKVTTLYRSGTSGAFLLSVDDFEETAQ